MKKIAFLDLWASPLFVNFGKRKMRFSLLGILLSLCIFAYLPYQFSQSQFVLKEDPIIVRQSYESKNSIPIHFDENHPIGVYIIDTFGKKYYDPTLLEINFVIQNFKAINGSLIPIEVEVKELHQCTKDDFQNDQNVFDNFQNTYCLNNKTINLKGLSNEEEFSLINIVVYYCNNTKMNNTCKPKQNG